MTHPLDPVTADELAGVVGVLACRRPPQRTVVFSAGWVVEPSRRALACHEAGEALDRIIRLVGYDREQSQMSALATVSEAVA